MIFVPTKKFIGIAVMMGIFFIVSLLLVLSPLGSFPVMTAEKFGQNYSEQQSPASDVTGIPSHAFVLDATLPSGPDKILVYKVVPFRCTRRDVITLGEQFGLSAADRIKEGRDGFGIMKEDHSMHAYLMNTGWAEFTNSNRVDTVNSIDVPENLPSDDEAVQIATTFLRERDLFPDGAEFKKTTHGRIYQLVRNAENSVTWEDINVWFGRTLNGYPVEGTQLMLAIGGRGDVIEYFTNWREYEPYRELPVKSPERAFEELKTKRITAGMITWETVSIREIYLAYHTKAGAEKEYYLEPVWVFKGDLIADGKPVQSIVEFIPALTDDSFSSIAVSSSQAASDKLITIDPISSRCVNESFNITGTTSLPSGSELQIEIYRGSYNPGINPFENPWYDHIGNKTKVTYDETRGTIWSYTLNTTGSWPDEYLFYVVFIEDETVQNVSIFNLDFP